MLSRLGLSGQSQLLTATMMQYVAAAIATGMFALLFGETWQVDWTPVFCTLKLEGKAGNDFELLERTAFDKRRAATRRTIRTCRS